MKKLLVLPVVLLLSNNFSSASDVSDLVNGIWDFFDGWADKILSPFKSFFFSTIPETLSPIIKVFNYIWDILKALWFWLTSLLSWVWDLAVEVLDGWVFLNVVRAFETISWYIWWPATIFLGTMLFVIVFRIFVAFVFKLFRLNIDYHEDKSRSYNWSKHDSLDSYKGEPLF